MDIYSSHQQGKITYKGFVTLLNFASYLLVLSQCFQSVCDNCLLFERVLLLYKTFLRVERGERKKSDE